MNKYLRPVLMTLACGIGGGIVMALLLLYMMITTVFTTGGLGFVLELLVAAALPLCLNSPVSHGGCLIHHFHVLCRICQRTG